MIGLGVSHIFRQSCANVPDVIRDNYVVTCDSILSNMVYGRGVTVTSGLANEFGNDTSMELPTVCAESSGRG